MGSVKVSDYSFYCWLTWMNWVETYISMERTTVSSPFLKDNGDTGVLYTEAMITQAKETLY